jgi:hypothetical protein
VARSRIAASGFRDDNCGTIQPDSILLPVRVIGATFVNVCGNQKAVGQIGRQLGQRNERLVGVDVILSDLIGMIGRVFVDFERGFGEPADGVALGLQVRPVRADDLKLIKVISKDANADELARQFSGNILA